MADNKAKNPLALLLHSGLYTAVVSLLTMLAGGLRWQAILLLFASHALLDQRAFVLWWCKHITKSFGIPWLLVVTDQSWHILFLAAVCALTDMI